MRRLTHCHRIVRGLVMFLSSLLFAPAIVAAALLAPATVVLVGLILAVEDHNPHATDVSSYRERGLDAADTVSVRQCHPGVAGGFHTWPASRHSRRAISQNRINPTI